MYRHAALGILGTFMAVILLALAVPIGLPSDGMARNDDGTLAASSAPASEDLRAFFQSRRWGASLQELREKEKLATVVVREEPAPPSAPEMDYVGLIVAKDRRTVLLMAPDKGVARLKPGDVLPDGRAVAAVAANSVTLASSEQDSQQERALYLFPPLKEKE